MSVFRPDSEFMEFLGKVADFVILNLLCAICSIPIVTAGAAITARNYTAMKMTRGEEPSAVKSYFKSFRENFRQVTAIWMGFVVIWAMIALDWYNIIMHPTHNFPFTLKIVFAVMTFIFWATNDCLFYLEARFELKSLQLVKTALIMALLNIPKMVLICAATFLPYIICVWYIQWGLGIWILCKCVSLYYISKGWNRQFSKVLTGGEV